MIRNFPPSWSGLLLLFWKSTIRNYLHQSHQVVAIKVIKKNVSEEAGAVVKLQTSPKSREGWQRENVVDNWNSATCSGARPAGAKGNDTCLRARGRTAPGSDWLQRRAQRQSPRSRSLGGEDKMWQAASSWRENLKCFNKSKSNNIINNNDTNIINKNNMRR